MKRRRLALLMLCLALLLSGCAAKDRPALSARALYDQMLAKEVLPPMVAVPEETLADFYGIEADWYTEGLFMVAADSLRADEVVLMQARDQQARDKILAMLNTRMEAKAEEAQGYSPLQHAIILKGKVVQKDLRLALLCSPDIEALDSVWQASD